MEAALTIIRGEGFQHVTTRKIADLAGVNVAAVNYHFGSKEQLLNAAVQRLTGDFREAFQLLAVVDLPPRERIRSFVRSLLLAAQRNPEVLKHAVSQSIFGLPAQTSYFAFLRQEGLASLKAAVQACTGYLSDEVMELKLVQLVGAIAYPVLTRPIVNQVTDVTFSHSRQTELYVDLLVSALLLPPTTTPE